MCHSCNNRFLCIATSSYVALIISVMVILPLTHASALTVTSTVVAPTCFGGYANINATAAGGVGPFTYTWSSPSNSSIFVVSSPAPVVVFDDKFGGVFSLRGNLNQSVICQGTGTFLGNVGFVPSRSGYCSLSSIPDPTNLTVFSVGCSQCIDTSVVCNYYFLPAVCLT